MRIHTDVHRQGWLILAALTAMNLLNYTDRYLVTALLPNIAADLHLSDSAGGLLGTAFMVVYFVVSPFFGWVGDRGRRPLWLGVGVGIWSLATGAAGLARGLTELFLARAAVGVGEAAYGTIAPSMLADSFAPAKRGRIMALFSVAMPVGAALGYLLGGVLGARVGWRSAFFWVGLPGVALAICGMLMPDPPRGAYDPEPGPGGPPRSAGGSHRGDSRRLGRPAPTASVYCSLWRNRRFVWTVAGYTAYTFALGGMAFWMPTYIIRVHHRDQASGMLLFGGLTVVTGICGTLLGGWLGDLALRRHPNGYVHLNIFSMLAATVAAVGAVCAPTFPLWMAATGVTQIFAFLSVGPVNAILIDAVPSAVRATATAVCIFFIHLFGDAISPLIIGALSDRYGLTTAMLMVPGVFLLAAVLWQRCLGSGQTSKLDDAMRLDEPSSP